MYKRLKLAAKGHGDAHRLKGGKAGELRAAQGRPLRQQRVTEQTINGSV